MTKRKPARDKNGHFLPHGQTPREKPRPDTPPGRDDGQIPVTAPPLPPPLREAFTTSSPAWPKLLKRPERKFCEDCGTEMQERRTIVRGCVIYLTACPRCCEDPVGVIRG